jgi:hypothetical protein
VFLGSSTYYSQRAAIDAAHILLQAASTVPKLSLLCSMLTERAAVCYLYAGQTRKYAFYQSICGNKFQGCGAKASRHAVVCFLSAMLVYEKTRWGFIKAALARSLALELRQRSRAGNSKDKDEDTIRSFLMTLRALSTSLVGEKNIGCKAALNETESLLSDLMRYQNLSQVIPDTGVRM